MAQGAFSAYKTEEVRKIGGWQNVLGEDIVLTYHLLHKGLSSTYEPRAVGYTAVPKTLNALYNQCKRWAIGMIEGLSSVPPWQQGTAYSRNFTFINLSVIYLDIAYLFGLIPAIIIAFLGYFYLAGFLTLFTLFVCVLLFCSMYLYQKKLKIPFKNSALGFILFILLFQTIQSTAALHGYIIQFLHRKKGGMEMKRKNLLFAVLISIIILIITALMIVSIYRQAGYNSIKTQCLLSTQYNIKQLN